MSNATRPGPVSRGQEHRANWFELFFDLVFVATLYVMAHELHGDPSLADFGAFLVLFFPAWWGWVNLMMTVNVFGPTNPRALVMLVAAMPGFGLMAAASPEGLGDRAWAYALGAAWVRLAYLPLWWARARRADALLPAWQPLLYGLLPGVLWAASAAVPGAVRFTLWAVAVGVEILLLTVGGGLSGAFGAMSAGHLVERVGLFVVIALGESVLTGVTTLADSFTLASGTAALAGFATITILAGDYYLRGSPSAARILDLAERTQAAGTIRDSVIYLPFLLLSGIAVIAAALGTAVAEPRHTLPPGALWALCGGLLAFHTANAALSLRFGDRPRALASWYPLCLVLNLGVLYPVGLVLTAWATVAVAALLNGGHLWFTSRPRWRRRRGP
ncbi:low temperature requirement protein A [Streptomyces sp. NPDC020965]|uniref:low temperature requirement protein A n=1 Tax=Streptomyces sp. NPDC020965 TaxID=3365105 RepID=UPI00378F5E17